MADSAVNTPSWALWKRTGEPGGRKAKQVRRGATPRQEKASKERGVKLSAGQRRASIRIVMLLLLLGLAGAGLWQLGSWLADSSQDNFAIRQIEVTGSRQYLTTDAVKQVLDQYSAGDFFNVDIDQVRASLLELPWVREVALRREWPDKLVIVLREQHAVARWTDSAGQAMLLNEVADVFAGAEEVQDIPLPVLSGPDGQELLVLEAYAELSAMLQPMNISVKALDYSARDTWEMVLSNGIAVRFLERNKASALKRLVTAFDVFDEAMLARIARIDLRYSNGFAIAEKETVLGERG